MRRGIWHRLARGVFTLGFKRNFSANFLISLGIVAENKRVERIGGSNDERVIVMERTNARHLKPAVFPQPFEPFDLAVIDCSFISLRQILPATVDLLPPGGRVVALVKPQFEVGRQRVGKGGVVRDPLAHRDAITAVIEAANSVGWKPAGLVASPLTGPAGNHEYLLWLTSLGEPQIESSVIEKVVSETLRD